MLSKIIIYLAYFLDSSKRYLRVKRFAYDVLENPKSKIKPYFDLFIIFLVVATVTILIYDIAHKLTYHFDIFEDVAVTIFILEWLGRFWISCDSHALIVEYHKECIQSGERVRTYRLIKMIFKKRFKYTFSLMSIIDLLAILPAYRPLRVLRIFLLFRLLKIFRYTKSLNTFFKILSDKTFEFNFLFLAALVAIFMSATIMYVFEGTGNNPNITSYLDAVYWAIITITTVGYGDITPVTNTGKIITFILVGGGFFILVLATSIATNALSQKMDLVRENKMLFQVNKLQELIVIIGFGRMGHTLAEELCRSKKNFVVVDRDDSNIQKARELGYFCIKADASQYETIDNLVFCNDVKNVVVTTDDDALNLSVLLTIKAENQSTDVIVRANSRQNVKKFKIAKADYVIFPYETVAEVAVEYIGNSVKFDAIENILLQKSSINLEEINIQKDDEIIGKSISEVLASNFNITPIAVLKDGDDRHFVFNPDVDIYRFEAHDTLVVIGDKKNIDVIKKRIARQAA